MRNIGLPFIALVLVSTTFSQSADQEAVKVLMPWKDHQLRGLFFANVSVERVLVPFYRSSKATNARDVRIAIFPGGHAFREVRDDLATEITRWIWER